MHRTAPLSPFLVLVGILMAAPGCGQEPPVGLPPTGEEIRLPAPAVEGGVSVEEALHRRRSVRSFHPDALDLATVGQLLWSAQGITDPGGLRTAPSAGALHPLELLVLIGAGEGLDAGLYRYRPRTHALVPVATGDRRQAVAEASLGQGWMAQAPVLLVVAAEVARTAGRYGDRAPRYVHMEVGHAAQNVYLQATALGLGTTVVGAFQDGALAHLLELRPGEIPLAVLPVGRPR
jgi:SagB-type dehydrogenase family enzyme